MSNAIGYIRVSTDEQASSGLGLEAQRERIRAYCGMRGMSLVSICEDAGVSGGKPIAKRTGGLELLTALKARKADVVVILKLDRAFRNAADCLATVEKWERQGVTLHIVDLGGNAIDTTSAAGKFMLTILAGAAEMERGLGGERTRAALSVKRGRSERIGPAGVRVQYGYCVDPASAPHPLSGLPMSLKPDPAEQAIIQRIVRLSEQGFGLRRIARALEGDGIQCRGHARWHHSLLKAILERHKPKPETPTAMDIWKEIDAPAQPA